MPETCFVAAENGLLPGAKVGGIADVVRDLPRAIAALGWQVSVVTPSYGSLHELPGARHVDDVPVVFRGRRYKARIYEVPASTDNVRCVVIDHRLLVPTTRGVIYHGDEPSRPFATDAGKFAFFCTAVASWLCTKSQLPDVIHLHDWHAGVLEVLRHYDPRFSRLADSHTVFTIHNLSYQGQRPLEGDPSSFRSWFPALQFDGDKVTDPTYPGVFNPMAAAIRLADVINTVSPTYAGEIQRPSNSKTGFIGGEGLETDLELRAGAGDLVGILNGCEYSHSTIEKSTWPVVCDQMEKTLKDWSTRDKSTLSPAVHETALKQLSTLRRKRPGFVLTSVGRIVDQKMRLLFTNGRNKRIAIADVLSRLGNDGLLILIGSGDPDYESRLAALASKTRNFLFLRGYSDTVAQMLYNNGDCFLMPSSYEPCGISQMLAMRAGQPCIVHGVGGLADTVEHEQTGFVFHGSTPLDQVSGFLRCVDEALHLHSTDQDRWQRICESAAQQRFDWSKSARLYVEKLYARK